MSMTNSLDTLTSIIASRVKFHEVLYTTHSSKIRLFPHGCLRVDRYPQTSRKEPHTISILLRYGKMALIVVFTRKYWSISLKKDGVSSSSGTQWRGTSKN